jgi:cysteinyl-tRNA synthetase
LQGGAGGDAISADAIEALIEERQEAKLARNYARADEIRQELLAQGVVLEDSREGTKWRRA